MMMRFGSSRAPMVIGSNKVVIWIPFVSRGILRDAQDSCRGRLDLPSSQAWPRPVLYFRPLFGSRASPRGAWNELDLFGNRRAAGSRLGGRTEIHGRLYETDPDRFYA